MSSDASSASSPASSSTTQTPTSGSGTDARTPTAVKPATLPTPSASEGRTSAGTGPRPMVNMRSSLVATINSLKPTPRDVISGIAPHVFDERSKRRKTSSLSSSSRQANRSPHGAPRACAQQRSGSGSKSLDGGRGVCARTTPSSPLRFSVVSWDDGSIIIEPTGRHKEPTAPTAHAQSSSPLSSLSPSASANPLRRVSSRADASLASLPPSLSSAQTPSRPSGLAKDTPLPAVNRSKWRSLRVDAHLKRLFVIKFRSSSRTNS